MSGARRQGNWDFRAAGNFIAGGAGSGLIVASGLAALTGGPFRPMLALGLGLIGAGLSLVWLEIGRPWRAFNVFFHPRTSWMTREGIMALLVALLGLSALASGAVWLALAVAVAAVGFLGCQAGILRAARAVPAWRRGELVAVMLSAGLAEGAGLALLFPGAPRAVLALALAACMAREVAWGVYRAALGCDRAAAAFATQPGRFAAMARWASLALLALAFAPGMSGLAMVGGALAFLAGATIKTLLITRAGFTRAISLPAIPIRGGVANRRT